MASLQIVINDKEISNIQVDTEGRLDEENSYVNLDDAPALGDKVIPGKTYLSIIVNGEETEYELVPALSKNIARLESLLKTLKEQQQEIKRLKTS